MTEEQYMSPDYCEQIGYKHGRDGTTSHPPDEWGVKLYNDLTPKAQSHLWYRYHTGYMTGKRLRRKAVQGAAK